MKCKACGSDDVTQSHGKCNECRWIYEQQVKLKQSLKEKGSDSESKTIHS